MVRIFIIIIDILHFIFLALIISNGINKWIGKQQLKIEGFKQIDSKISQLLTNIGIQNESFNIIVTAVVEAIAVSLVFRLIFNILAYSMVVSFLGQGW